MNMIHTFHTISLRSGKSMMKHSPKVSLRKMTLKDYDSVIALWAEGSIPYRPQGRDSRKNITIQLEQPNCYFLVAETDKKIIGAIVGTHDGRKGWINRLVIAPSYQKKGIAKRLVEEVEHHFSAIGIDIIACLIEDWNTTSMQVFEKLGYTKHTDILYYSKRKSMKT